MVSRVQVREGLNLRRARITRNMRGFRTLGSRPVSAVGFGGMPMSVNG